MATPSFYHPQLKLHDELIKLDSNEASHAVKSRRLRTGQQVRVFNGLGLVAIGSLAAVDRRDVTVQLQSIKQVESATRRISIAVALPKGDRQKIMVDMLTQLGVFEIIPLRCKRSVSKFSENTLDKWVKVAVEACKQSQNPLLPKISNENELDQLLNCKDRTFAVANADGAKPSIIAKELSEITVLVGPEGGFSDSEFAMIKQAGIPSMRVGTTILRTEVAAVAIASVLACDS